VQISARILIERGSERRDLVMHQQRCRNTIDIVELFHSEQQRFMR